MEIVIRADREVKMEIQNILRVEMSFEVSKCVFNGQEYQQQWDAYEG